MVRRVSGISLLMHLVLEERPHLHGYGIHQRTLVCVGSQSSTVKPWSTCPLGDHFLDQVACRPPSDFLPLLGQCHPRPLPTCVRYPSLSPLLSPSICSFSSSSLTSPPSPRHLFYPLLLLALLLPHLARAHCLVIRPPIPLEHLPAPTIPLPPWIPQPRLDALIRTPRLPTQHRSASPISPFLLPPPFLLLPSSLPEPMGRR